MWRKYGTKLRTCDPCWSDEPRVDHHLPRETRPSRKSTDVTRVHQYETEQENIPEHEAHLCVRKALDVGLRRVEVVLLVPMQHRGSTCEGDALKPLRNS